MAQLAQEGSPIIIRPARRTEYGALAKIAAETYFPMPLMAFLSPGRAEHYRDYERGFEQRALTLMLDPRMLSFVACEAADPDRPIGYIHAKRLGDDAPARAHLRRKDSVWLAVCRWLAWAWFMLLTTLAGGNKSEDREAMRMFASWDGLDGDLYWEPFPERWNRWHVQSFVVRKEFQGRGVGKKLMRKIIKLAEEENVVIGLESSPEGEFVVSQLRLDIKVPE
jgi:GNAT superfamily N-acetyltransferase